MHVFPPIDELRYLIGTTLTRVTIDPYQISFYLEDSRAGTTLTSGYALEFKQPNGRIETHKPDEKSSELGSCRLHKMLDDKVVAIDLSTDGLRLCLSFARGSQLTILSELDGYECGTIACGGGSKQFWVF